MNDSVGNGSSLLSEVASKGAEGRQNTLLCVHEGTIKIFRLLVESTREFNEGELNHIKDVDVSNLETLVYVNLSSLETDSATSIEKDRMRKTVRQAKEQSVVSRLLA